MTEIKTGVPEIAEELAGMGVNPEQEALRRIVDTLTDRAEQDSGAEFALMISKYDTFMISDPASRIFTITLSVLVQVLNNLEKKT